MNFVELKSNEERDIIWFSLEIPDSVHCCECGKLVDKLKSAVLPNFNSYPKHTNKFATVLCGSTLCMANWLTITEDERGAQ